MLQCKGQDLQVPVAPKMEVSMAIQQEAPKVPGGKLPQLHLKQFNQLQALPVQFVLPVMPLENMAQENLNPERTASVIRRHHGPLGNEQLQG